MASDVGSFGKQVRSARGRRRLREESRELQREERLLRERMAERRRRREAAEAERAAPPPAALDPEIEQALALGPLHGPPEPPPPEPGFAEKLVGSVGAGIVGTAGHAIRGAEEGLDPRSMNEPMGQPLIEDAAGMPRFDNFGGEVLQGAGSTLPFIGAGVAGSLAGPAGAIAAPALLGYALYRSQALDRKVRQNMREKMRQARPNMPEAEIEARIERVLSDPQLARQLREVSESFGTELLAAGGGALEAAPWTRWLGKILPPAAALFKRSPTLGDPEQLKTLVGEARKVAERSWFGSAGREALEQGLEEAAQEGIGEGIMQWAAGEPLDSGAMLAQMPVGFVVGSGFGGAAGAAQPALARMNLRKWEQAAEQGGGPPPTPENIAEAAAQLEQDIEAETDQAVQATQDAIDEVLPPPEPPAAETVMAGPTEGEIEADKSPPGELAEDVADVERAEQPEEEAPEPPAMSEPVEDQAPSRRYRAEVWRERQDGTQELVSESHHYFDEPSDSDEYSKALDDYERWAKPYAGPIRQAGDRAFIRNHDLVEGTYVDQLVPDRWFGEKPVVERPEAPEVEPPPDPADQPPIVVVVQPEGAKTEPEGEVIDVESTDVDEPPAVAPPATPALEAPEEPADSDLTPPDRDSGPLADEDPERRTSDDGEPKQPPRPGGSGRDGLSGDGERAGDSGGQAPEVDGGTGGRQATEPTGEGGDSGAANANPEGGADSGPAGSIPRPSGTGPQVSPFPQGQPGPGTAEGGGGSVRSGAKLPGPERRHRYDLDNTETWPQSRVPVVLEALRALKDVWTSGNPPTDEQRAALSRFGGFGGIKEVFKITLPEGGEALPDDQYVQLMIDQEGKPGTQREILEIIRELFGVRGVLSAAQTVQNAHYTRPDIAAAMWRALGQLGINEGTYSFLEPGSGIGTFVGSIPADVTEQVVVDRIERDPLTATIGHLVQPDPQRMMDLRHYHKRNVRDGAIGNVPFAGGITMPVKGTTGKHVLHDAVILKALQATRPGGLAVLITSRYTLDKQDATSRLAMLQYADLLKAARLPSDTHEETARTEVVVDVLMFRRREEVYTADYATEIYKRPKSSKTTTPQQREHDWLYSESRALSYHGEDKAPLARNRVFRQGSADNPYRGVIFGNEDVGDGLYGGEEYIVRSIAWQRAQMPTALQRYLSQTEVRFEPDPDADPDDGPEFETVQTERPRQPGEMVLDGSRILVVQNLIVEPGGMRAETVEYEPASQEEKRALLRLVPLLDPARELFQKARDPSVTDEQVEELQRGLREAHDKALQSLNRWRRDNGLREVPAFGALSGRVLKNFRRSTGSSYVFALERKEGRKWSAGPILSERVGLPPAIPDKAGSALEALVLSLIDPDTRAQVSLPAVARRLGISEEQAAARLRDERLAFYNPIEERWEPAARFLSGNVVEKARLIRDIGASEYSVEIKALERARPAPIALGDVSFINLGDTWIDDNWRRQFIRRATGLNVAMDVNRAGGQWSVRSVSGDATDTWLDVASGVDARKKLEHWLNHRPMRITYKDANGTTHRDLEAEEGWRNAVRRYDRDFRTFIIEEHGREAQAAYNERVNVWNREEDFYPGTDYRPLGLKEGETLREPQVKALFRGIIDGSLGIFHWVGTGKTLTMGAIALELKRLGLARKSMLVVNKKQLADISDEIQTFFPGANVYYQPPGKGMNTNQILQVIATGDHDLVVVTKTQFNLMVLSPGEEIQSLERDIAARRAALAQQGKSPSQIANAIEALTDRLNLLMRLARGRQAGQMFFDDIGVDTVLVDEADDYKNFGIDSMNPNLSVSGTATTQQFMAKMRWLHRVNPGRGIYLATGTPIANKATELWTMFKYLAEPWLAEQGRWDVFDNFARDFFDIDEGREQKLTGRYEETARPRFKNHERLQEVLWQLASIVSNDELDIYVKRPKANSIYVKGRQDEGELRWHQRWTTQRFEDAIEALQKRDKTWPDPVLRIYNDTMIAGIDLRTVDPLAPEQPDSLLNQAADRIADVYARTAGNAYSVGERAGATQAVFIDRWQLLQEDQRTPRGINVIETLIAKLKERGVAESDIISMTRTELDEDGHIVAKRLSDKERDDTERKLNRGEARIIIGSTRTIGTGVNMQVRMAAAHHLDVPYRPKDVTQRNGRLVRVKNENEEVDIYYYTTEGANSGIWGLFKKKAEAFEATVSNRRVTDAEMAQTSSSAGLAQEVLELLTGNPLQKQLGEAESYRRELLQEKSADEMRLRTSQSEIRKNRDAIDHHERTIEAARKVVAAIQAATKAKNAPFGTLDGKAVTATEMAEALRQELETKGAYEGERLGRHHYEQLRNWLEGNQFEVRGIKLYVEFLWAEVTQGFRIIEAIEGPAGKLQNRRTVYISEAADLSGKVQYKSLDEIAAGLKAAFGAMASEKGWQRDINNEVGKLRLSQERLGEMETLQGRSAWTEDRQRELDKATDELDRLQHAVAEAANAAAAEEHFSAEEERARAEQGRVYSAGRAEGTQMQAMADRRIKQEATKIIRQIFPHVRGIGFADALHGHGPALALSQQAAGQPVTAAAEVGGMVDRGRALVAISLNRAFDPLKTSYHEAYHLARQLANEQERAILERSFVSEEHEAVAFAEAMAGAVPEPGPVGRFFAKLRLLFERLGNMLRGLGYRSVSDIFADVTDGVVGARMQATEARADALQVAYSTRRSKLDYIAGVLNKEVNFDVVPEDEAKVELLRAAWGYDSPGTQMKMDDIRKAARELVAEPQRMLVSMDWRKGEQAGIAFGWRWIMHESMVHLGSVAKLVKADPDNQQLVMQLDDAHETYLTAVARSSAHASEIGLALRSYGEPLGKLRSEGIQNIGALINMLERGIDPPDFQVPSARAGQPELDPESTRRRGNHVLIPFAKLLQLSKSDKAAKEWAEAARGSSSTHETLKNLLLALRKGEIEGLLEVWQGDRALFHKLLDAFIEMARDGIDNTTKAALEGVERNRKRDWALWLFYNSLLSSPVTQRRNLFGGAMMHWFAMPAEMAGAATIGAAGRTLFGWKKGNVFEQSPEWQDLTLKVLLGAQSDYQAAWKAFFDMWVWGKDTDPRGQFESKAHDSDISQLAGPGSVFNRPMWKLSTGVFWPVRIMSGVDRFFRTLNERRELRLTASRLLRHEEFREMVDVEGAASADAFIERWVLEAPDVFVAMARNKAREVTFTQPLTGISRSIEQWRNKHLLAYPLLPFIKILSNQVAMGLRLLPGATLLRPKGREALRAGGRKRNEELYRVALSLALPIITYFMVSAGRMTGGGEEDRNRRNVWRMIRQPGSVLLNGRWHYLSDWTEHFSLPMHVMATIWETLGVGTTTERLPVGDDDMSKFEFAMGKAIRIVRAIPESIVNKSWAQGPAELYRYARNPEKSVTIVTDYMSSYFPPNLLKWINRTRQDVLYEESRPSHPLLVSWGAAGGAVPPRLDPFGDPLTIDPQGERVRWLSWVWGDDGRRTPAPWEGNLEVGSGYAGRKLDRENLPWSYSQPVDGPEYDKRKRQIATELNRLGVGLASIPGHIDGIRLKPWERYRLGQLRGWLRYVALERLLSTPKYWEQTSDPLRSRLVNETLSRASITAREFIGLELAAGNARLADAFVKLHGPQNFGQRPLRRGRALLQ